jgi:hypothetical protein
MTTHEERKQVIVLLNESIAAGARQAQACEVLGISERTLNAGKAVMWFMPINVRYAITSRRTS